MDNSFELFTKISLDLKELEKSLKDAKKVVKKAVKDIDKNFDSMEKDFEKNAEDMADEFKDATKDIKKDVKKTKKDVTKQLDKMADEAEDSFEDMADEFDDAADDMVKDAKKAGKKIEDEFEDAADEATGAFKGMSGKLKGIMAGVAGAFAIDGIRDFVDGISETVAEMGKLETAFESAGGTAKQAESVYKNFFTLLGDEGQATEAAQLLANMTTNQKDLATWTQISTGVYATFGDALPIEGLIESANETAKVGEVTGSLADALNWAGISEDEFNDKLAKCTTEQERQDLIMNTLNGTYDEAAKKYEENNKALMDYREANLNLQDALTKVGEKLMPVVTWLTNLGAGAVSKAGDVLGVIVTWFQDMAGKVDWETIKTGLSDLGTLLGDTLLGIFEGFSGVIQPVVDGLKKLLTAENVATAFDKLKEAFIYIEGHSENIGKGLGIISLGLLGLQGLGFIGSLAGNLGNLVAILSNIGNSKGLFSLFNITGKQKGILDTNSALGGFASILRDIAQKSENGIAPMGKMSQLFTGLGQTLAGTKLGQMVSGFASGISQMFASMAPLLANPYVIAIAAIVATFVLLWNTCDSFKQSMTDLWNNTLKPIFTAIWDILKGTVIIIIQEVIDVATHFWENLKSIGNMLMPFLEELGSFFGDLFSMLTGGFADTSDSTSSFADTVLKVIKWVADFIGGTFKTIWAIISWCLKLIIVLVRAVWGIVEPIILSTVAIIKTLWTIFKKAFEAIMGIIKSFAKIVAKVFGIETGKSFTKMKDNFVEVKDTVINKAKDIIKWFKNLPKKLADVVTEGRKKIKNAFANFINAGIEGALGGVNKLIEGVNKLLSALGITTIATIDVDNYKMKTYAKGTNHASGGLSLVGEAGREIVSDKKLGTFVADQPMLLNLTAGASVLRNSKTEKMLRGMGIRAFAGGKKENIFTKGWNWAKDTAKDVADKVKDVVEDAWSYITNPKQAIIDIIAKLGLDGNSGNFFTDKVIEWIKDKFANLGGVVEWFTNKFKGLTNYESGNVDSYKGMIQKAAGFFGDKLTDNEMARILQQIRTESGGNPKAIQSMAVDDINSRTGNLARGLLQYVPSTFNYRKVAGYGDIWNPYHQLLAFFNNTTWRKALPKLGEIRGWTPRGAKRMADGGLVKGGRGGIFANIGEASHDELVIPLNQQGVTPLASALIDQLENSGDISGGNITVNVPVYLDGKVIAEETIHITDTLNKRKSRKNGKR